MRSTVGLWVAATAILFVPLVEAGAPQAPAAQRFAVDSISETPNFQRHIMPLLGKQGCNGRSCHGSFQGRGGLRLSLFGYDMKFDHEALTKLTGAAGEPRVDLKNPGQSLILAKTVDAALHEGGQRLTAGAWEHRLFVKWIEKGCPGPGEEEKLARLVVEPAEILFRKSGEAVQLRVTAIWADGTSEDVTCLSRFRTNNEAVTEIDSQGKVTALSSGDTHVVAFYDNGVASVPVVMPLNDRFGPKYPTVAATTAVDKHIVDKLRKLGIVPSDRADDAEFVRRVTLDITGTLPTPAEVEAFLADTSSEKRKAKIDKLLETPEYSNWWATKFCDLTGNNPRSIGEVTFRNEFSDQWYRWLETRIRANQPYDEIVAGMLLATSRRPGQSYGEFTKEMVTYLRKDEPADFADHPMLSQYWSRNSFRKPEERVLGISYAFLGIRIQCAECHKHPFDQWTQSDFKEFAKFFTRISYGVDNDARAEMAKMEEELGIKELKNGNDQRKRIAELARAGEAVPLREVFLTAKPKAPVAAKPGSPNRPTGNASNPISARLLGGATIDLTQVDDPRVPVMDWLRSPDNPFFAKALVNRVWAHYFGRGIIEPADDLNLANPPANGPLLDHLAKGFIANKFDLKWLHREIANSDAYQRTWHPNETNEQDRRNFSRMIPRRLPAEVAYDAVVQATTTSKKISEHGAVVSKRAISHASILGSVNKYAVQVFGKPERATTCDCERSAEPTLLQAIFLQNDRDTLALVERGGWIAEIAGALKEPVPGSGTTATKPGLPLSDTRRDELIREAYLRTLARLPTVEEVERARTHIAAAKSASEGVRDVLWALLNTREFIVNH